MHGKPKLRGAQPTGQKKTPKKASKRASAERSSTTAETTATVEQSSWNSKKQPTNKKSSAVGKESKRSDSKRSSINANVKNKLNNRRKLESPKKAVKGSQDSSRLPLKEAKSISTSQRGKKKGSSRSSRDKKKTEMPTDSGGKEKKKKTETIADSGSKDKKKMQKEQQSQASTNQASVSLAFAPSSAAVQQIKAPPPAVPVRAFLIRAPRLQSVQKAPVAIPQPTPEPAKPASRLPPGALEAMDRYFQYLMNTPWNRVCQEYMQLQAIKPHDPVPQQRVDTTAFEPSIPCLESTRLVSLGVDFYHASKFNMPPEPGVQDLRFILAQIPSLAPPAVEAFWSSVFQAEPGLMVLLCPLYENGRGSCFFPTNAGEYVNYGQMCVTAKGIDKFKYGTIYLLEVLPDGCSNALFIRMIHCEQWEPRATPGLKSFLTLMQMCRETDVNTPVMCISRRGTGRPAILATAVIVYSRLLQGRFTPIDQVATALRQQRALAFDNLAQYSYIYVAVTSYIKNRLNEAHWSDAMEHMSQWGPELFKFLAS